MLYIFVVRPALLSMNKLVAEQAECLLCLGQESDTIYSTVSSMLSNVEAHSALAAIRKSDLYDINLSTLTPEEKMLKDTLNKVSVAEKAMQELKDVFERRKMPKSKTFLDLFYNMQRVADRLYRVIWEIGLNQTDSKNMHNLVHNIADISVWEDEPCGKYERVTNEMNGVIAYKHCFGITFVEYKTGKATTKAWSVLRTTFEEAVLTARKDFREALQMCSPTPQDI